MSHSEEPAFNAPPVTLFLVASIIVSHILLTVADQETINWIYGALAFDVGQVERLLNGAAGASLIQFLVTLNTHMILHHDFMHMLVNAFMLLAFGSMVERTFGPVRFVIVFLVAGWVGAILEALVSMPVTEPSLLYGASGGVFGTMGVTTLLMLPKFGLRGVVSFAAVLMGVNLVIGLTPLGALLAGEGATISWAAHVGGYVTGLLFAIWFLSRLARRP